MRPLGGVAGSDRGITLPWDSGELRQFPIGTGASVIKDVDAGVRSLQSLAIMAAQEHLMRDVCLL